MSPLSGTPPLPDGRGRRTGGAIGIEFHSVALFWAGILLTAIGVLLHLPDFLDSASMGYRMAGMEMSWGMHLGMGLILGGMAIAAWGLLPRDRRAGAPGGTRNWRFHALDDAPLSRAHMALLFTLAVALVIDVMKPATLGFVMPGTKAEYGLTARQVALLPLVALTGTTIGSLGWGMLADRMGRRASILLASILFIGTSICGFMPSFAWNLVMCFVMGLSAGGMLPVVYALMTESVPASRRGWIVVLYGGLGTIGGYLAASGLAALLEPVFSWRILWFAGLPTGLVMLALNRFIPESPRFLLEHGRVREAREVMARYGVVLEDGPEDVGPEPSPREPRLEGIGGLFRPPFLPRTLMLALYGLGWGIVNWGFLTFLPTFLRDAGFDGSRVSGLLFLSALIAIPGAFLVAWLYGMWSSKKALILYAGVTAAAVAGFSFLGPDPAAADGTLLVVLVVVLLVASGGAISMLSPYAAEVFPTHLRGSGSGLAAGSSKLGGILGPPIVASVATLGTGLTIPALVTALPVAVAAVVLSLSGVETRGRTLEELGEAALAPAGGGGEGSP